MGLFSGGSGGVEKEMEQMPGLIHIATLLCLRSARSVDSSSDTAGSNLDISALLSVT